MVYKINKYLNFKLFLILTTYLTIFITDLFYFSPTSQIFQNIQFTLIIFLEKVDTTLLEQNLSYYFLQSLNLFLKMIIIHITIMKLFWIHITMVNNILYIIGIVGVYNLLKYFKFSKQNIYFSLILLNFFLQ